MSFYNFKDLVCVLNLIFVYPKEQWKDGPQRHQSSPLICETQQGVETHQLAPTEDRQPPERYRGFPILECIRPRPSISSNSGQSGGGPPRPTDLLHASWELQFYGTPTRDVNVKLFLPAFCGHGNWRLALQTGPGQ